MTIKYEWGKSCGKKMQGVKLKSTHRQREEGVRKGQGGGKDKN